MEFKYLNILKIALLFLSLLTLQQAAQTISSFQQLGQYHCNEFPIEILWRLATGHVSQKYGESYFDYDCYIRQFVKKDGMTIFQSLPRDDDQDEDEQQSEEEQQQTEQAIPQNDPIVQEYAKGLQKCLPKNVDPVESVYSIWRFIRFIIQHDYAFQWLRAKIRSGMGYQAERPSTWMDGEMKAQRLRLDKLFSNQFYEYVDQLMFKDFLYPIMTFLKKNTVFAVNGDITESGKPILVQSLQIHNYHAQIFKPIILRDKDGDIFSYTIPGIPLLFAGSNSKIAWAFTGVLVDRSNIEQIQTVNNKFYNFETEEWIPLTTENITIPGAQNQTCSFTYSASGTLYSKKNNTGKVSQYISKWHENEKKVRVLFSDVYNLIKNNGVLAENQKIEFPFNSIVIVNQTGIYQYLCPQFYPSYFLYPDMFGEPEKITQRWISYKKKYVAISNTLLTTTKQEAYKKGELLSPTQEQIAINLRKLNIKENKFTTQSAMNFILDVTTSPYIKKQREMLTAIYRKVKFIYFPENDIRKQGDQIISLLEKWDNSLNNNNFAPIYLLWEYFYRDYTFNYVSASQYGLDIARHKVVSDIYWANQMALWQKGTSYGQCDSHEYQERQHQYNGTGHNSTCYFNIMRGFNKTRQIISQKYGKNLENINLKDFEQKKILDLSIGRFKGTQIQQVFKNYYSRQLFFGAQIGSQTVRFNAKGYQDEQISQIALEIGKKTIDPMTEDL